MKRSGIINSALNAGISQLGHGDLIVVADCGLPTPAGVPVVDLALVHGIPRFEDVLDALLGEMVFQACFAAEEAHGTTAGLWIAARFPETERLPHEELKRMSSEARLIVRTGEATPYANVVLECGVPF